MRSAARFLLVAVLLATACAERRGPTAPDEVRLSVPFQLDVGESAVIRWEPLRIGFRQVTEDSRCPAGVYCTWQGEIAAALDLRVGGGEPVSFELSTVTRSETRLSGYRIQLLSASSAPYLPGQVMDPRSYHAEFVVTR